MPLVKVKDGCAIAHANVDYVAGDVVNLPEEYIGFHGQSVDRLPEEPDREEVSPEGKSPVLNLEDEESPDYD
ncbi:hypothetical protein V0288_11240 [Pannus brasiliensis CCIBt3594]|uniref:Uncharacterized protein n=1 Tax=Pannus brasiliensis CCIBt3594 TaxID=1427578 RepID=A0AAW9QXC1_9CHRO